jgi:hypothetical protein
LFQVVRNGFHPFKTCSQLFDLWFIDIKKVRLEDENSCVLQKLLLSACLPFHGQWPQNNIINLYPSKVYFTARVILLAMIHYNFGSYKQTNLTSISRVYYKWHIGPKIQTQNGYNN